MFTKYQLTDTYLTDAFQMPKGAGIIFANLHSQTRLDGYADERFVKLSYWEG